MRYPHDDERVQASLAHRRARGKRSVRMAHLASVGSHAINGVASAYTPGCSSAVVLRDFYDLYPGPIPQRHQRRDAKALDGRLQSGPHEA